MKFFKNALYKIETTFRIIFSLPNLKWHLSAIVITFIAVISGFDWQYYLFSQKHNLILSIMLPAVFLGFLIPIIVPIFLLIKGRKNLRIKNSAYAVIQAEFLAWAISSLYKAFSGRIHPELVEKNVLDIGTVFLTGVKDISREFNFGFWREGIFWGWPSSHTTVVFALVFALVTLFPESKKLRYSLLIYAFYIGIGVSLSIHWFSDFAAGAIIGTLIGISVGRVFMNKKDLLDFPAE